MSEERKREIAEATADYDRVAALHHHAGIWLAIGADERAEAELREADAILAKRLGK